MKMVLSFKYLVMTIDCDFKCSEHVQNINKMRRLTNLLNKIRFLNKSVITFIIHDTII